MKPSCTKCYYYNLEHFISEDNGAPVYDHTNSFCGLHGRAHIDDPNGTPPNLAHRANNFGYACMCGFYPRNREPVQLTMF